MYVNYLTGYPYLKIRYTKTPVSYKKYNWLNKEKSEFPPDWLQNDHLHIENIVRYVGMSHCVSLDPEVLHQNRLYLLANAAAVRWPSKYRVYQDNKDDSE